MKRLILPLVALLAAVEGVSTAQGADRPNLLLITADDLGLQLGCYGDPWVRSPRLDALAAGGVRFETAYVAQASCSPSRSAMFTGLYSHSNGQIGLANAGFTLDPSHIGKNLPAYLKATGYRTGIIGKLHVAPESSFPFDYRPTGLQTRDVALVAETARPFLGDDSDAPFFLMVNYSDPHVHKESARDKASFFPAQWKGIPTDPLAPDTVPGWPFQGLDTPEMRERVSNYYNTVMRLDTGVGMLLDELKRAGHADDTVVVFLGDHGPPFCRGKTTCYESGLRVPFLVRWPGVAKPHVSTAFVSAVDIVPTFLDAAGIPFPREFHGRSLRPLMAGDEGVAWRETLAAEFHYHGNQPFYPRRAIRDQRWKLIHNLLAGKALPPGGIDADPAAAISQRPEFDGTDARRAFETFANPPEFELYDLSADPVEFHNVAGDPGNAETLKRLQSALKEWREETADPLLDPAMVPVFADRGKAAAAK